MAKILGFSELSVYTEVVLLKTFPQHFEVCLYYNIEEVMKFYNLGDKTFETDFSIVQSFCQETWSDCSTCQALLKIKKNICDIIIVTSP